MTLTPQCTPSTFEQRWREAWHKDDAFTPKGDAESFTIVMPPPNVTGSLHLGHALNATIQDILTRYARMRGKRTLWQPGLDHAGIATQTLVARQLEAQGHDVAAMGREEFLQQVWLWKDSSARRIRSQFQSLGVSCDWSREIFTLDPGVSKAVTTVFVQLYRDGLIYRDQRLINWDPQLRTAISDLELRMTPSRGHLWRIRYRLKTPQAQHQAITIATTRPETLFADTAVAVHPSDARFSSLVGQTCLIPLINREIPIIADERVDPDHGTGALKITPAHDFTDFDIGQTHQLETLSILTQDARLNEHVPPEFQGLTTLEARKAVVLALTEAEHLEGTESIEHSVPHGDRSGSVVEPRLSDQWFVETKPLAQKAIKMVEQGDVRFFPESWTKTYFEWMRNIKPWCVSRQLWWGHRIPAWYTQDGQIFVAHDEQEALALARESAGDPRATIALTQDPDVLDTWFSSALWPFTTMGWPEDTEWIRRHFPSNVLLTAFDIIFFWVARMIMMSAHFTDQAPFQTVYVHPLLRDAQGRKMSKSKGNIMDPLELSEQYGTDATRLTLAALTVPGRNIRLSNDVLKGYRNFVSKLWNVARFADGHGIRLTTEPGPVNLDINHWILGSLHQTIDAVSEHLNAYRFDGACLTLYQFVWHTLADWYVEFTKPILTKPQTPERNEIERVFGYLLDTILRLLHPITPFVTEELWHSLRNTANNHRQTSLLIHASWPIVDPTLRDRPDQIAWLRSAIGMIRSLRAELNIQPSQRLEAVLLVPEKEVQPCQATLTMLQEAVLRLGRLSSFRVIGAGQAPDWAFRVTTTQGHILAINALHDEAIGRLRRLPEDLKKIVQEREKREKRLANPGFLSKADPELIEETEDKIRSLKEEEAALKAIEHMLQQAAQTPQSPSTPDQTLLKSLD